MALPATAIGHLVRYFEIEPTSGPYPELFWAEVKHRNLLLVDLVLALLRGPRDLRPSAEALAGVPIKVVPGFDKVRPLPVASPRPMDQEALDLRRVIWVARNPRLPTSPAFQRFKQIRVGRTVQQCLTRGVTRRDLREALGHEWVKLGAPI